MQASKRTTPQTASKASRTTNAPKRKQLDAITLLKRDHAEVKKMYKAYERLLKTDAPGDERQALAMAICHALSVHAKIEEEIFYPKARQAIKDEDIMDHADVEHASAKALIRQIESMDPHASHYDAKVCVLCEYVAHHVKEEEDEMFPKVQKAGIDLIALGEALAQRKERLLEAADPVGTPAR